MPVNVEVSSITTADVPGAVRVIQEAFTNDPYSNWMFDSSKFSPQRNATSLGLRCEWGMRNALFYVAKEPRSGKVLGVSMWLRPQAVDHVRTWHEWMEEWWLWLGQLRMNLWYGRGGLNVKRYWIWKDAQNKAHDAVWTDKRGYYFLNIMTVLPELQGQGIGKKLVQVVTDRADEEGMPCYLESSRDVPNIQIYERMGFEFVKQLRCDDDGHDCMLYCMVRRPRVPQ